MLRQLLLLRSLWPSVSRTEASVQTDSDDHSPSTHADVQCDMASEE